MQSAYAMLLSDSENLDLQEKYLLGSIEKLHLLYVLQYKLLLALLKKNIEYFQSSQKKYIPTNNIITKSRNFIENKVVSAFDLSAEIQNYPIKKDETNWEQHSEIVDIIWSQMLNSKIFIKYLSLEHPSFEDDKKFIIAFHNELMAPNDNLHEFYESEVISWTDDIPFVNTWIYNNLYHLKENTSFRLDGLYKDPEDKDFAKLLFRKTMLNFEKYEKEIEGKTPNWESDRITKVDKLLMVMAISEFLNFPSIPTKVTINEYIELAKDYSTQNSSVFINGVLDKLVVDFTNSNKIQKTGRGLL